MQTVNNHSSSLKSVVTRESIVCIDRSLDVSVCEIDVTFNERTPGLLRSLRALTVNVVRNHLNGRQLTVCKVKSLSRGQLLYFSSLPVIAFSCE